VNCFSPRLFALLFVALFLAPAPAQEPQSPKIAPEAELGACRA